MQKIIILPFILFSMSLSAQHNQPSNKHFWYSLETAATPEKIWQIWTDVSKWNQWDTGLQSAEMSEKFALNATGITTSLEGRKSKFRVVAFEEGRSYTFKTSLPLGGLYVKRYLETKNGKTVFTHYVRFSGVLGGLFAKKLGPKFRAMLPDVLQKINEIAVKK